MTTALIERHCKPCGETKPVSEFYSRSWYCKVCMRLKSKLWHSQRENLDKRNLKVNERHKKRKLKAIEYKGGNCQDCGGVFHYSVYDFHHTDGSTKLENPSYFIKLSWEKAITELDKCVLLCANCHRIRHFQ